MFKPETIGSFEAKTHLARLLRDAGAGKSFVITVRGKPVAELRPLKTDKARRWGDMRGKIKLAPDFCAPLDDMQEYME